MNAAEINVQMIESIRILREREAEHDRRVREVAEADKLLRIAEATAYLASTGTVGERDAAMKKSTSDERYRYKLAAGLETSALEAIRNGRAIISALQSVSASHREEAHLARYMDRELEAADPNITAGQYR